MSGLRPKKKLIESQCYHWCIHCKCSIRDHSLGQYSRELARYEIVCKCGECPGYARDESRAAIPREKKCTRK